MIRQYSVRLERLTWNKLKSNNRDTCQPSVSGGRMADSFRYGERLVLEFQTIRVKRSSHQSVPVQIQQITSRVEGARINPREKFLGLAIEGAGVNTGLFGLAPNGEQEVTAVGQKPWEAVRPFLGFRHGGDRSTRGRNTVDAAPQDLRKIPPARRQNLRPNTPQVRPCISTYLLKVIFLAPLGQSAPESPSAVWFVRLHPYRGR